MLPSPSSRLAWGNLSSFDRRTVLESVVERLECKKTDILPSRATSPSEQRSSSPEPKSRTDPSHNGSVSEPVTPSGTIDSQNPQQQQYCPRWHGMKRDEPNGEEQDADFQAQIQCETKALA